ERARPAHREALGAPAQRGEEVPGQLTAAKQARGRRPDLDRRRQQHRVDDLEPPVAVGEQGPQGQRAHQRRRARQGRAHSRTLATSSFTTRVISLSYCVNSAANRSRTSGSLIEKTCLTRPGADVMTTTR